MAPRPSLGFRGGAARVPRGARALLRPRKIPAKPPSAPADSPKSPAEFFKSPRLQGLPENARRDAEIPPKEPTTRPQKRSEGVQCTQQHFLFSQEVHGVLFPRATIFYTCIFFCNVRLFTNIQRRLLDHIPTPSLQNCAPNFQTPSPPSQGSRFQ